MSELIIIFCVGISLFSLLGAYACAEKAREHKEHLSKTIGRSDEAIMTLFANMRDNFEARLSALERKQNINAAPRAGGGVNRDAYPKP